MGLSRVFTYSLLCICAFQVYICLYIFPHFQAGNRTCLLLGKTRTRKVYKALNKYETLTRPGFGSHSQATGTVTNPE